MDSLILSLQDLSVRIGNQDLLKSINLDIRKGEQWAILGPSGGGKTVLAETICGRHFYSGHIEPSFCRPDELPKHVLLLEHQHRFRDIANQDKFYYQQRYNSFDSELTRTVQEDLDDWIIPGRPLVFDMPLERLLEFLHIDHLLNEPLIELSNGENKRLQLAKALVSGREFMILDKPFTGLDTEGRQILRSILELLAGKHAKMLLITTPKEVPAYITHIGLLSRGSLVTGEKAAMKIQSQDQTTAGISLSTFREKSLLGASATQFNIAVRMKNVHVRYGEKQVLQGVDWEVKKGEKWGLSGPNGSGKSTLLSLIMGDHPQAYANEIYLFDRRRGSGESIWDIKQRIGFLSPELQWYFDGASTCFQTIASGLFDTIGLYRRLSKEQEELVCEWLSCLGMARWKDTRINQLAVGAQRMVLLARAMIKRPALLVLDEPCQGLDDEQIAECLSLIDTYCQIPETTLIYVSHYQDEIPGAIQYQLLLKEGRTEAVRNMLKRQA